MTWILSLALIVAAAAVGVGLGVLIERDGRRRAADGAMAALAVNNFVFWLALPTYEQMFGAREPMTDMLPRQPGEQEIMYYDGQTGFTRRVTYVGAAINCWKSSGGN